MKITVITVGKIKEKYLKDAIAEYSKRLSRYCKLEILEVADEKTPDGASEIVEENIREKRRRTDFKADQRGRICHHAGNQRKDVNFRGTGRPDRDTWNPGEKPPGIRDRRIDRTWKRSVKAFRLCTQFFQNDISASAYARHFAGADLQKLSHYQWRAVS